MDLFRRFLQKIMEKLLPPFECEGLGLRLSVTSPEGARSVRERAVLSLLLRL